MNGYFHRSIQLSLDEARPLMLNLKASSSEGSFQNSLLNLTVLCSGFSFQAQGFDSKVDGCVPNKHRWKDAREGFQTPFWMKPANVAGASIWNMNCLAQTLIPEIRILKREIRIPDPEPET